MRMFHQYVNESTRFRASRRIRGRVHVQTQHDSPDGDAYSSLPGNSVTRGWTKNQARLVKKSVRRLRPRRLRRGTPDAGASFPQLRRRPAAPLSFGAYQRYETRAARVVHARATLARVCVCVYNYTAD